ncbi:Threonine/homoserine/homoserine lactone efflux protein [Onishia taeanensis]|jgi:threonine/homoserine/homoserine lactone efflux protein|uniref:Threonine/homoserine/homoserine lactone efflux protein n=1 Tax=Onishia taeanensis TaxID=284577 RepID=A0A1G7U8W0_9GAMM|nr:LysE family translocator [Halomonas taeanensis]MAX32125.1 LysE family translocator [Halomonadaceae bacterium]SDG44006.1 Threonine/homoserine/homoserine lactone efflux protein [Halomonas taeanensis]
MSAPLPELLALIGPMMLFSISMSATPGPNNMMLTASGANYGFLRTLPHMLGISIGVMVLMGAVALGLGALFERWPPLQQGLKVAGSAYLLWLAYKIATAPPPDQREPDDDARPLTFWQAAAFQFANPKAWVMAISGIASFTLSGDAFLASAVAVILVMGMTNLPSIALWAGFGVAVGKMMKTRRHWRVFNAVMGLLTAACVLMILS